MVKEQCFFLEGSRILGHVVNTSYKVVAFSLFFIAKCPNGIDQLLAYEVLADPEKSVRIISVAFRSP